MNATHSSSEVELNKFDETNPTDREKMVAKTNVLEENTVFTLMVEGHSIPLSIVVCRANRHDSVMLAPLLTERFVSPDEDAALSLNLCLDAGYIVRQTIVEAAGYVPGIGAEKRELEHTPTSMPVAGCRSIPFLAQTFS
ncbi:MAG: hypothetical protein Q4D62_15370 [Planctomycetia bacterium]|nr:hypothetical protein [Planctomycetia bacterium]